jgi:hypothetical protein
MFKSVIVLSLLFAGSSFAQDMSSTEDYKQSYVDMPDGSSRYTGKCSTHEDYDKFYFKTKKTIQKYVEPSDLSDSEIAAILGKFDKKLIGQILKTLHMNDIGQKGATVVSIFKDYIDDITVDTVSHLVYPGLDLIRFNVGIGGGNGSYLIFNKVKAGSEVRFDLMSYTMDSDLNYCDRAVWLQNIQ